MAIGKFQTQEYFNKPIGVVTPSRAGLDAAQGMERLGAQMVGTFFQRAVDEQEKLGQQTAAKFAVRDEKGQLNIRTLDESLSPIARQTAQPIIDENYRKAIFVDMKNAATRIRADHKNDPDGFDDAFTAYIKTRQDLVGEKFASFVKDTGTALAGENYAALYADKIDAANQRLYQTDLELLNDGIQEMAARASSGVFDEFGDRASLDKINAQIDQFAEKHADKLSGTAVPELKKAAKRAYFGGVADNVLQTLSKSDQFSDPRVNESLTTSHINAMERALQQGSFDGMNPVIRRNLEAAGFTEELFGRDNLDAESARVIASDLSTYEGNLTEQMRAEKASRIAALDLASIEKGDYVSQSGMDNIMEQQFGIYSEADMFNKLPDLMQGQTPTAVQFRQMILRTNSPLPTSLQKMFESDDAMSQIAGNGQLGAYLDIFRQSTFRMAGGQAIRVTRGLSDKAFIRMNELSAYQNTVKDKPLSEFFQEKQKFDQMEPSLRKAALDRALGTRSNKQIKLEDFVLRQLDDDADADEITFHMQYADELVLMHGKDRAAEILQQAADAVFTPTTKIFDKTRSRYSPESVYADATDRKVFEAAVRKQIALVNPNLVYGKDVFLVPDRRTSPVAPTYLLVDKNGLQMVASGKALMVTALPVQDNRAKLRARNNADFAEESNAAMQDQLAKEERERNLTEGGVPFAP